MAAQPSPVTAEVVAWAVREDGRSVDELADALKVETALVAGWVAGRERPTVGQVSKLATVLQRPRALFFLPRPPVAATLPPSFRHPPGDDDRQVSAAARRRVRQARRVQQAVAWALANEPPADVPLWSAESSPEEAAANVRQWLGITPAVQAGWENDYDAMYAWREALDAHGVLVFALEIGAGDIRGFSAWDERAPLIVMNASRVTPAARSFTLGHELGHLVTRKDAACVELPAPVGGARIERWCEEFGAALLMPRPQMIDLARQRRLRPGDADLDDVTAVKRRFRVSARAAALRLIELGFAQPRLYGAVLNVFVPKPPAEGGKVRSPPRWQARLRQYGPRTLDLVLSELPPLEALSVLRVEVDDVRRLVEQVPGAAQF